MKSHFYLRIHWQLMAMGRESVFFRIVAHERQPILQQMVPNSYTYRQY